jgi:ubiquinone/menaquinone biosynthesis C-methylase UbiE
MSGSDASFIGAMAELYDDHLGPVIFEPYAIDLTFRLRLGAGDLLEIAAGTGIVTRALERSLPPEVRIVATDLNEAMLDRAAQRLSSDRVTWRQADAQALPF